MHQGRARRRVALVPLVVALSVALGVTMVSKVAAEPPTGPVVLAPADGSVVDAESTLLQVSAENASTVHFYGRRVGATVPTPPEDPDDFTFVVIPDTQDYTYAGRQDTIRQQAQWIVDNRNALNIKFAAHLGDLVSEYTSTSQWQNVSNGLRVLDDAALPNSVVAGNHDFDNATGAFAPYDTYFPVSRYSSAPWNSPSAHYGGYMGQNLFGNDPVDRQNMNNFSEFRAGGRDFLVLSLEWEPPSAVIDWANRVVAAYPNHSVILVTHGFVNASGNRPAAPDRPGGTPPAQMWNDLVFPNCNIRMVVNGHYWIDGQGGEARRNDTNRCGQPVQQFLSDYQSRPNGGDGWLRYYTFKPTQNVVEATTYSPTLNSYETDANSSFQVSFDIAPVQPAPFTEIGVAQPVDGVASASWANLQRDAEYEWYAVARVGTEESASAVARFTVPPPSVLAFDTFSRSVASGWGTSDSGHPWTVSGALTGLQVSGGLGRLSLNAGQTRTGSLPVVTEDASLVADVGVEQLGTGSTTYVTLVGRANAAAYRARLRVTPAGAVDVYLARFVNNVETILASGSVGGLSYAAGQRLKVRFEYFGSSPTTLRARVWRASDPEPQNWNVSTADSTASVQGAGPVGLITYVSSSSTVAPVSVTFDTFDVLRVGGSVPTTTTTTSTSTSTVSTSTTTTTVPSSSVLAFDTFSRSVASGWGTSDSGHPWTVSGALTGLQVSGGLGRLSLNAGQTRTGSLPVVTEDASLVADVGVEQLGTGSTTYVTLVGRANAAAYRARLRVNPDGSVLVYLARFVGGSETTLASATVPGVSYAAGQRLKVRFEYFGSSPTTLRARVWRASEAEPQNWNVSSSDSTAGVQGAGPVGLITYVSSSSTVAPVSVTFDTFDVLQVGGDVPTTTTTTNSTSTTTSVATTTTTTIPSSWLAYDSFARSVASGWGSSDSGHPWTVSGAVGNYSVANSQGRVVLSTPGATGEAALAGLSLSATRLQVEFSFDKPASASLYASAVVRRVNASNDYRAKVAVSTSGRIQLVLARRVGGTATDLVAVQLPASISYAANRVFSVVVEASGNSTTTVRAKVWIAGQAEPDWQATVNDGTAALQQPGTVALGQYLSSSGGSVAPLTVSFRNLQVAST